MKMGDKEMELRLPRFHALYAAVVDLGATLESAERIDNESDLGMLEEQLRKRLQYILCKVPEVSADMQVIFSRQRKKIIDDNLKDALSYSKEILSEH